MSGPDKEDFDAALGLLSRALVGELELLAATGTTWIPRPAPKAAHPPAANRQRPAPRAAPEERAAPPKASPALPVVQPVVAEPPADVDAAIADVLALDLAPAEKLARLEGEVLGDCRRCKLHRGRTKIVFGAGNPEADLVFVGEGPGSDEDRLGVPFVGKAGQLLTKMIEAMQLSREDVYICNVVKCRPPNNRNPEPDELHACERFLKAQLAVVRPRVIVALGKYATQILLDSDGRISDLRGRWARYERIDVLPTFHPAYLLRSPEKKREAWADLQEVMRRLGEPPAG